MEKTYAIMRYPFAHNNKKEAEKYIGAIKNNILDRPVSRTIAELAWDLVNGHTVILGDLSYSAEEYTQRAHGVKIGACDKHWKSQQIFAVDIDNDGENHLSLESALGYCAHHEVMPAFIYTTDSHTKQKHRFRVVFVMDENINNEDVRRAVVNSLFNVFMVDGKCAADVKCSDASRLFYPGKEIVYQALDNVIDHKKLILLLNNNIITSEKKTVKKKPKTDLANSTTRIELLKARDIKGLRKSIVEHIANLPAVDTTGLEGDSQFTKHNPYLYKYTVATSSSSSLREYVALLTKVMFRELQKPGKPHHIRLPEHYYATTSRFPLHILLDLPLYENFQCILPSHADTKSSARIELDLEGRFIYHCYGCCGTNRYLDLFDVLEQITGWSHADTKRFVNTLFNVSSETEWQAEKKMDITEYQDYIISDDFKEYYVRLYKNLARSGCLGVLNMVLSISRRYIYSNEDTGSSDPMFYMALSSMTNKLNDFSIKCTKSSLHKKLKYLTNLGLLKIVPCNDLPDNFKSLLVKAQVIDKAHYRMNCFAIPMFSVVLLDDAEKKIYSMKMDGVRKDHYCRELELRAHGKIAADAQYVLDMSKDKKPKTEVFYQNYKMTTLRLLDEKGWTTEKEILSKIRGYSEKLKTEYSGICLPQLLKELDLSRIAFRKQYEELFKIKKGILKYGASKIILESRSL